MPATAYLYDQKDDAEIELASLDRHTAEAKDAMRAALELLGRLQSIDDGGRCFEAILEAVDDFVSDKREPIRSRIEEADIEIGNIEECDLRRSAPMVL